MKIEALNSDRDFHKFYLSVAPLLCNKEVSKEIGTCLHTDSDYIWFVAFRGESVLGFVALHIQAEKANFIHEYIVPQARRKGLYAKLYDARINYIKSAHPEVEEAVGVYSKSGYNAVKSRKHSVVREFKNFTKISIPII